MQDLKTWSKTHKKWVDTFVLELRFLDVPGAAIGDQLTTVYAHCQETGEEPETAFGEAKEYANSLGYVAKTDTGEYARIVAPSLVSLLAMFVFNYAISAIANGHNFMLNWAVATIWGVSVLLVAILLFIPLRVLMGKPAVIIGFAVAISMLSIAGALFSRFDWRLVVDAPALPVAIVSALVMIGAAIASTRIFVKEKDDAVTSPLQSEEEKAKERKGSSLLGIYAAWILPVYSAISAIITLAF